MLLEDLNLLTNVLEDLNLLKFITFLPQSYIKLFKLYFEFGLCFFEVLHQLQSLFFFEKPKQNKIKQNKKLQSLFGVFLKKILQENDVYKTPLGPSF